MANPETAVTVAEPQQTEVASMLEGLMRAAKDPTVDPAKFHLLLDAQERILDRHNRQQFNIDFAAMQLEMPNIPERGVVKNKAGGEQSRYAKIEDIQDLIKPVLEKHGFAVRAKTNYEGEFILVTTIITHKLGHSEETTLKLPRDESGSKNNTQGVGSSASYGFRYGLRLLLNLRMSGVDDDAQAVSAKTINVNQDEIISELLGQDQDRIEKFCGYYRIKKVGDLPLKLFDEAVAKIRAQNKKGG